MRNRETAHTFFDRTNGRNSRKNTCIVLNQIVLLSSLSLQILPYSGILVDGSLCILEAKNQSSLQARAVDI